MDGIRKIAAFERSAPFLHRRAVSRWQIRSFADALPLMRRAAEADPGDPRYRLDLMRLLSDMGREDEALRYLARASASAPINQETLFQAARCLRSLGREEDARNALTAALQLQTTPPPEQDEITDMLFSMSDAPAVRQAVSRRQARALMANRRAGQALAQGRISAALRLSGISLSSFPGADARLLRGRALLEAGDKEEAARQCRPLAFRVGLPHETRLEAISVMDRAGRPLARPAFLQLLRQAPGLDWTGRALELGGKYMDEGALLKRLLSALDRTPYHPALLHVCAVCMLRRGHPATEAAALWQRALTVEPDDMLALYCLRLCQEDPRKAAKLPLSPAPPEDVRREWLSRMEALDPASPELLPLCRWAIRTGERPHLAARLLAGHPSGEAELTLRALLMDPALDQAGRMTALGALIRRGVAPPFPVLGLDSFCPEDPLAPQTARRVPLSVYLALKTALSALGELSPSMWEALMLAWSRLLTMRLPPFLKRDWRGLAAALTAQAMAEEGVALPEGELRYRFGCSQRRIDHCLNVLYRYMGKDDEYGSPDGL